jgi:rRNA maturation RNase YbeY
MEKEISFFYEDVEESDIKFNYEATERWLFDCLEHYKISKSIVLSYIFVSDEYLLEMNKTHLDHDYYTDIITFNYNEDDLVSGDMFISIDRISDNAKQLSLKFADELDRVIVHGLLHLIGFNDKTNEEQLEMTKQENYCLELR